MHETCHTTPFGTYYYVEVVRIDNYTHMLKLRVKLRFSRFLSFFGTLAHKAGQTWFNMHETWQTTLFGIYYCVEVVKIKNHSHMLELTY